MAKKKANPTLEDDLRTIDHVTWCKAGPGYLQCRRCGSKIRVGGAMNTIKDGKKVQIRRAWCPHKWWAFHESGKCQNEQNT